ncbi:hypothetical protein N9L26_02575 [Candidatus Pacebacteria bacterium]|nr:hypothetical protein [Candidatus Paceibacterota bacterium]
MKNDKDEVATVIETVENTVNTVVKSADDMVEPIRRSALKRFPVVFLLLVTFGVVAVLFAFERILSDITYLNQRPWLILTIGIGVLAGTGTLYKKLS